MSTPPQKKSPIDGSWLAIGIAVGVAIGVTTDNLGLWLALGVAIGCTGPLIRGKSKDGEK
jgi:hypothetical protein